MKRLVTLLTNKKMQKLLLLLLILMLPACATLSGDSDQAVSVTTPFCLKASCELSNDEGTFYIKETPETVLVNKSFNNLTILCEKNGYSEIATFESSANGYVFGNILFGGVIGLVLDGHNGSGYDYDTSLVNPLRCAEKDAAAKKAVDDKHDLLMQEAKTKEAVEEPMGLWEGEYE